MKYIIILFIWFSFNAFSQEHLYGVLLDSTLYRNSPTAAPLTRGDYDNLPLSVSLKEFSPTPGNQGSTGTCSAWASAYAGRTMLDAIKYQWDKKTTDNNSYSPSFVYNQIRINKTCKGGTSIMDALDVLKNQGAVKYSEFGFDCSRDVTDPEKLKARNFRIIEYRDIFSNQNVTRVQLTKKSIAEKRPVIIALDCPHSIEKIEELFKVDSIEYRYWGRGHALVVVGYDDHKFGGAFEILNSWGVKWGNNGFFWIKYQDYQFFCRLAFELIDKDIPDKVKYDLSGTLSFRKSSGEAMKVKQVGEYFVMEKFYPSGTLFELRISNNEPAYVYAFSSDLTFNTYKIFPFNNRMVAYLPYSRNNIAIPDEDSYNMLDSISGKSYYCFLYSKIKLDIDNILQNIEIAGGNMWERIKSVLGDSMVDNNFTEFKLSDKISFNAKSKDRSVIPLLIEIDHFK